MIQPLMTTLTLLLVAGQQEAKSKRSPFEYAIYDVVENLIDIQGYSDAAKADLYGMLAEWVDLDDSMLDIEAKVWRALTRNKARFPHG